MSSDHESQFDLPRLPDVPLLVVLRYLDTSALNKMSATNRTMYHIIEERKSTLAHPRIDEFSVMRLRGNNGTPEVLHNQKCVVKVTILPKPYSTEKVLYFERPISEREHRTISTSTKEDPRIIEIEDGTMFLEWLAEKFSMIKIYFLKMSEMSFTTEEMDRLEVLLAKNHFRVKILHLCHCAFSAESWNNWTRFVKLIKVNELRVSDTRTSRNEVMFSRPFLDMLSTHRTLRWFENGLPAIIRRFVKLPIDFQRYPPIFYARYGIITPWESFHGAVKLWMEGDLEMESWLVHLPSDCPQDVSEMVNRLEFPRVIIADDIDIILKNADGKKAVLIHQPDSEHVHTVCWHITEAIRRGRF